MYEISLLESVHYQNGGNCFILKETELRKYVRICDLEIYNSWSLPTVPGPCHWSTQATTITMNSKLYVLKERPLVTFMNIITKLIS